ncbi:MAG: hypothetical protein K5694_01355 [Bacilli bacterium]|nr:hypothetical protein [Bacilli bacterium]
MKKSPLFLSLALFASLGSALAASLGVVTNTVYAEEEIIEVDYSPSKWVDFSDDGLWSIDETSSIFEFGKDVDDWSERQDKRWLGNFLLTDQFDIRGASVSLSAVFQGSTSCEDISKDNDEVHLGIVPWYLDSNNWVICYAKYIKNEESELKDGSIFDFQFFVNLDGSNHVEYFVKDDGNRWVSKDDPNNSIWHSAWPDRINQDKNPTSLEETKPDPSEDTLIEIKKTRRTYATKECDSFYVRINGYELNFGNDNFMFSGLKEQEDKYPALTPFAGFYIFGSRKTTISSFTVALSHDVVLPLPTVEPLTVPITTGTVNTKIKIPEFAANDNNGEAIPYELSILDPDGEKIYLDGDDFFIPVKIGRYEVRVTATDSAGYTGEYEYHVKVKNGTEHLDKDVYDDYLTNVPKDVSIPIAYAIFISIPVIIVLWIGLKVFFYFRQKKKGAKDEK